MAQDIKNNSQFPLIIVSGPSGVGKTIIVHKALDTRPTIKKVITCTTRAPRQEEQDGVHYRFLSASEFNEKLAHNEFLEWAHIYDDSYGTLKSDVNTLIDQRTIPLFILDTQGAHTIKKSGLPCITIFIKPESTEQIVKHLSSDVAHNTRQNDHEDIEARLEMVKAEIAAAQDYDFTIINKEGDIEGSVAQLVAILDKILEKSYK